MRVSANKFIPAVGNKLSIRPQDVSEVGGAEKFVPGLNHTFAFDVSESGTAHKYIPGLGTKFFVKPEHTTL